MTFQPGVPPGHRLAYDRDGSAVYRYAADGAPNHPPQSDWKLINNEANSGIPVSSGAQSSLAVLFPVAIHLRGYFFAHDTSGSAGWSPRFDVSSDTTNGQDGNWTTLVTNVDSFAFAVSVLPNFRSMIASVDLAGIVGVRLFNPGFGTPTMRAIHVYVDKQETFLKIWHPTLDQELAPEDLDWGVMYAGEADTRQFRVKNLRGQQANSVVVSSLSHTGATIDAAYTFSLNGVDFSRPLNIGNIAAGAMSAVVDVKLAPPLAQAVSVYASQIHAIPGSWT